MYDDDFYVLYLKKNTKSEISQGQVAKQRKKNGNGKQNESIMIRERLR